MAIKLKDNLFEYHETDYNIACVGINGGTDNFDIREGLKKPVHYLIITVKEEVTEDKLIFELCFIVDEYKIVNILV